MADVIAQHNVGGGNLKKVYDFIQECQTFQLTSNIITARKCLYIRHRDAGRSGTLGDITIAIYDVDGAGKPTGPSLGTVTIASTNWSGILGTQNPMEDAGVEFSDCTLQPSTPYALVISAADGNSSNYIYWYSNTGGYSDGEAFVSADGGSSWAPITGEDFGFQIFGEPLLPEKPTNPTPTHTGTDIDFSNLTLSWVDGGGADTYNVYVGDAADNLTLISSAQVDVSFVLSDAQRALFTDTCYWRIDAINEGGTTIGDGWWFVVAAPGKVQNPTPTDDQEDIKITGKDQLKILQWEVPD